MATPGKSYKTIEELLKNHHSKMRTSAVQGGGGYEEPSYKNKRNTIDIENKEEPIKARILKTSQAQRHNNSQSPFKYNKNGTGASPIIDYQKINQQNALQKVSDSKSLNLNKILVEEEDERFRYLLKYGNVKRIEKNNSIIYAELPQIPGTLVFYRKISEREENVEKLFLENKELNHIPLLEGEEKLKLLSLKHNKIDRIQNLVSLPNLIYLDMYDNQISEIENIQSVQTLRVLMIAKNRITKIKNLECLVKLDVLDLHSNLITKIDGLRHMTELRILNLANNSITSVEELSGLTRLCELNLKINQIENIEPLARLKNLTKLYLAKNKISKPRNLKVLHSLTKLVDLTLEDNPIASQKSTYMDMIINECESLQTLDYQNVSQLKQSGGPTSVREDKQSESKSQIKTLENKSINIPKTQSASQNSSNMPPVSSQPSSISTPNQNGPGDISRYKFSNAKLQGENKRSSSRTRDESNRDDVSTATNQSLPSINESKPKEPNATEPLPKLMDKVKTNRTSENMYGTLDSDKRSQSPAKNRKQPPVKDKYSTMSQSMNEKETNQAIQNNGFSGNGSQHSSARDPQQQQYQVQIKEETDPGQLDPEIVIKIIQDQYQREIVRVEKLKKMGIISRKELYKDSLLEGGHAEIENNSILYLYGNSFEVMLPDPAFQTTIEMINFEFTIFEVLTQSKYLNYLKQFKKLQRITFKNNNITTFLQIAKLEVLPCLKSLNIQENPICSCKLLREFIVYRFPDLREFNGLNIEDHDKVAAKMRFKEFDNILMIPTKIYGDHYRGHSSQKMLDDISDKLSTEIQQQSVQNHTKKEVFEKCWNSYLNDLIMASLDSIQHSSNNKN